MSIAFLMLLAAAGGEPEAGFGYDPLAEAREGRLQCYQPDLSRRTCKGLAGFSFEDDGRIVSRSEVLVEAPVTTVMRVTSQVKVRGDAVCGPLADLERAEFLVQGRPATEGEVGLIRFFMSSVPRHGEVCTRWVRDGDGFIAHGMLDGEELPEFEQRMVWVEPDDGFVVGP